MSWAAQRSSLASPEGEGLAEEQQCGKAPRELMDAEINPNQPCDLAKLWGVLKEIIILLCTP